MGAIAVIRLQGADADTLLRAIAPKMSARTLQTGEMTRTSLLDPAGHVIDDALLVRVAGAAPTYELHVHGGVAVVDAVVDCLRTLGARVLSLQALLAECAGGIADELHLAFPRAVTDTGLRLLLAQERLWINWSRHWREWLQGRTGAADLWPLHTAAQWVLHRSQTLRRLFEPARIAIIGPPNAGKSTLANALLGRPVAITSAQAGTTRDWVDAPVIFSASAPGARTVQVPVILVDTAGVRDTADILERESIARTHHQAASADLILFLADATRPPAPEEFALLGALGPTPLVLACNKADLPGAALPRAFAARGGLLISARTHAGLSDLMHAALRQLDLAAPSLECFAFSVRRRGLLSQLSVCDDPRPCAAILLALGDGGHESPLQ